MKAKTLKNTPDGVGETEEKKVYLGTIYLKNPTGEAKFPVIACNPPAALHILTEFARLTCNTDDVRLEETYIIGQEVIDYIKQEKQDKNG